MFNVGEKVWYAGFGHITKRVVCPECFGKKFLTIILGDDSKVIIDCFCAESQTAGFVTIDEWGIKIKLVVIVEVRINKEGNEYLTEDLCLAKESRLFLDKEQAEKKAKELVDELNKQEELKIYKKEKYHHTWAWNVHYHRECIKKLEKDLNYHKAKLNVAEGKIL